MTGLHRRVALCLAALLPAGPAAAQRVLECRFVSDAEPGSNLAAFSFAAEITGGQLRMLLTRPPPDVSTDPVAQAFQPVRPGVSVHHEMQQSGQDGPTAELDLATVGPGGRVLIDQWRFGGTDSTHALRLDCPAAGGTGPRQ